MDAAPLVERLLSLGSPREGADFFGNESPSVMCLDLLLNQRVGVERATAASLAVHHHFGEVVLRGVVGEVTRWPYDGMNIRAPARNVMNVVAPHLVEGAHTRIEGLAPSAVGGLASLERYLNRANPFFEPLRQCVLPSSVVRSLSAPQFREITEMGFNAAIVVKQLASVATLLEMKEAGDRPGRKAIRQLERVGDEAADTLLVYLFGQRAVIVDAYLRRILYRHGVVEKETPTCRQVEARIGRLIQDREQSHRLHARADEIGVLFCHAQEPDCASCPLESFERRSD